MTEEEKEAMHREQYLRQLKAWKQEEALMVNVDSVHFVENCGLCALNYQLDTCARNNCSAFLLIFLFSRVSQFAHAYAALSDARAERKSTAELIQMVGYIWALIYYETIS